MSLIRNNIGRTALLSAFFVPTMGAVSIFYAMETEFNRHAVFLGVLIFIAQWIWVFRSERFQHYWAKTNFKIAFIINSVIRLFVSLYLDVFLFALQIMIYDRLGISKGFGIIVEGESRQPGGTFLWTLYLTLSHGVIIQLVYAICLAICYAIVCSWEFIPMRKKQD